MNAAAMGYFIMRRQCGIAIRAWACLVTGGWVTLDGRWSRNRAAGETVNRTARNPGSRVLSLASNETVGSANELRTVAEFIEVARNMSRRIFHGGRGVRGVLSDQSSSDDRVGEL